MNLIAFIWLIVLTLLCVCALYRVADRVKRIDETLIRWENDIGFEDTEAME